MPMPLIMGVLNVTPDSFSDGGRFFSLDAALARARELRAQGADIIDVGGESTRPGAAAVPSDEETERVVPVIEAIARTIDVRISVDTRKPDVARAAVLAGATIVNDVSGGSDPAMARLATDHPIDVVLMHMRGTPETMQSDPVYPGGVVAEVRAYLVSRVRAFEEAGVPRSRLWIDPGIGFGKTLRHNLELLAGLDALADIAERVVIGTSRKSFLARLLGDSSLPFEDREPGTIASTLWAYTKGASVLRVHDVAAARRALTTWEAIANAG